MKRQKFDINVRMLDQICNRKHITREKLAKRMNMCPSQLSSYCTGRETPSYKTAERIAKFLHTDFRKLFAWHYEETEYTIDAALDKNCEVCHTLIERVSQNRPYEDLDGTKHEYVCETCYDNMVDEYEGELI